MTTRIAEDVLGVLRTSVADSNAIFLTTGQLERRVYEGVNEVLTRLGGKWKRSAGGHVFPYPAAPLLDSVLLSGEMPPKNPDAFFPTPAGVVDLMIQQAQLELLDAGANVLEPSAGLGAIADAVRAIHRGVLCIEINPYRAGVLRAKDHIVWEGDFIAYARTHAPGSVCFDRILMNPPFAVESDKLAYIAHIREAFGLLAPGGILVGLAPAGLAFRTDKRTTALREFVDEHGAYRPLPDAAFRESGTKIQTVLVTLNAPES